MRRLKRYDTFLINELNDWVSLPVDVNTLIGTDIIQKIQRETKNILSRFDLTKLPSIQNELVVLSKALDCDLPTLSNPKKLETILENKINSMKFESIKNYIIDNWTLICKRIGLGTIIGGIVFSVISALMGADFQTTGLIWIISNTVGQLIVVTGALGPVLKN